MNYEVIDINTVNSESIGALSYLEGGKDIPFNILRVYYIYGAPQDTRRGGHAHKQLKQILFCPYGRIKIIMDDGFKRESVVLDRANKGLLILPGIWREMIWLTEYSVLCVAASMYYNEEDYIRNYDEFKKYIRENGL